MNEDYIRCRVRVPSPKSYWQEMTGTVVAFPAPPKPIKRPFLVTEFLSVANPPEQERRYQ